MSGTRITAMTLIALVLTIAQAITAKAQWGTSGSNIYNTNTGNVGIGTTAPTSKLDVVGDINAKIALDKPATTDVRHIFNGASAWLGQDGTNGEMNIGQNLYYNNGFKYRVASYAANIRMYQGAFQFQTAGSGSANGAITWTDAMVILANGRVGIGTSNPAQKLQVVGGSFGVFNSSSTGGATIDGNAQAGATSIFSDYMGGAEPKLHLSTYSGRASSSGITIDTSGNVGIGTTSPSMKLHVVGDSTITGNLTVTGNIAAKYQDVAEWVESSQALPAGTVVVLDQTKSNQVIASSHAYDTRVAGVISAQPGITLGERGDSKVLVATTGRVKVRVDATHGPIQVGDLLVTSDVPGVAMKSQPLNLGGAELHRPGTLIGKALEPLAKGTGEILVLLSLQ